MSDIYARVFENNRRWAEGRRAEDPTFFEHLAQGQNPDFLFIGCSDSRVPPELLTGLGPNDLFIHRNIANQVLPADANSQAVLQYAVLHLKVRHIVVCGHTGCGGVQAAMESDEDLGVLGQWLDAIRGVYRLHRAELDAIDDIPTRLDRLSEFNVREQCLNLLRMTWLRRACEQPGGPQVHGWVYHLRDGILKDLELPIDELLADRVGWARQP